MSALSTAAGYWYRFDYFTGRFVPLSDDPGDCDGVCCVTGWTLGDPENLVTQILNATAQVDGSRRWTVNYQALKAAYLGGNRLTLTPA